MKKIILPVLISIFSMTLCWSQDTIKTKTKECISAKILEVTTTEIKYKKFDNLDGPTFTIPKSDVSMIRYKNGTMDIIKNNSVAIDDKDLTKKGNKVFIEIPDEASRSGEKYFIDALKEWGYWKIVEDENESQFIIVFYIEKKAMADKSAFVIFKSRAGKEFKKSDSYRASTTAFNGYNAYKGVADKIVKKYFTEEFK